VIRELTAEQRQAWVEAMMPVWTQFAEEVGQENIDAAQAINAQY
jgi:C4-dicarboxylate-binding protein DctP